MKRCWFCGLFLLCGCSTHPVVDTLDYFFPGKIPAGQTQPHGGVCLPQGAIQPPGPALPAVPAITVPVVPPPAPLPGAGGSMPPISVPPPPSPF